MNKIKPKSVNEATMISICKSFGKKVIMTCIAKDEECDHNTMPCNSVVLVKLSSVMKPNDDLTVTVLETGKEYELGIIKDVAAFLDQDPRYLIITTHWYPDDVTLADLRINSYTIRVAEVFE